MKWSLWGSVGGGVSAVLGPGLGGGFGVALGEVEAVDAGGDDAEEAGEGGGEPPQARRRRARGIKRVKDSKIVFPFYIVHKWIVDPYSPAPPSTITR